MVDNTLLIGGGVVAAGLVWFMSQKSAPSTPSTLEDTQATSFVGVSGGGDADNKVVAIEPITEFLEDCAGTNDGSTATVCETPLWSANETVTLTHPLAATNSDFATYTFTVTIVSDIITSGTEASFNALPEGQVIGDYSIEVTRSGASYESGRWTTDQNATFANGSITKSNALTPASSVIPSWDAVLAAFGGYMQGKIGGVGDEILMRSGNFSDVGEFKYEKQGADGNAYPVTVDKFGLTMSGTVIPMYAQMEVKCDSGSWVLIGNPVQVTPANTLGMTGDNADGSTCYAPCFPAAIPTSGVALGCTIPLESKSLPQSIRVIQESGANTSYANHVQISIDELITSPYTVSVPHGNSHITDDRVIYDRLFSSLNFPLVHKDGGGYYVLNKHQGHQKAYISTFILGFDALYQRRQVQCTCPGGSANVGDTVTIYDTNNCPTWYNQSDITQHCGGVGGSSSGGSNDDGDTVGDVIIINPIGVGDDVNPVQPIIQMAENTLNARNFINTGHSFLNW